jgi:hypothetical protein
MTLIIILTYNSELSIPLLGEFYPGSPGDTRACEKQYFTKSSEDTENKGAGHDPHPCFRASHVGFVIH